MTDGTSQGLFIVVAIVIFGIFVVLAYILFEDTLSPALASMFNESFDKVTEETTMYTDESWFIFDSVTQTITGFNPEGITDYPKDLIIPNRIKGVAVRNIGISSFSNLIFDTVKISNTVHNIDRNAFRDTKILNLDLGKSVKEIRIAAFHNSDNDSWDDIEILHLPNSLELVGQSAFDNRRIMSITGGEGLRYIHNNSFQNAKLTGELALPNLEIVEINAFRDSSLGKVIIPLDAELGFSWTNSTPEIVRK